jgi:hypothetical protein
VGSLRAGQARTLTGCFAEPLYLKKPPKWWFFLSSGFLFLTVSFLLIRIKSKEINALRWHF